MRSRGLFWPSLFWLAMIAILVALGTWQIQRLHWKEGLIAEREAGMRAPPVALPATLAEARALEYRHVEFTATFQNRRELFFHAIAADGTPGYHVVTPAVLPDGRTLFVDRGFVPETRRDPATRPAGQFEGPVRITGLVRLPAGRSSWFVPANEPAENLWFTVDLPAMAAADHVADALPFYVDADASPTPGGLPIGGQTRSDLPNDHLQYALTWYGLAGLAAIYYVLILGARLKERRKGTA